MANARHIVKRLRKHAPVPVTATTVSGALTADGVFLASGTPAGSTVYDGTLARRLTSTDWLYLDTLVGPLHYDQATADATTAVNPTLAQVHAARDAAGVGTGSGNVATTPKIVRILGNAPAGMVMDKAYQRWEFAEGALTNGKPTVNGLGVATIPGATIQANGCEMRGGKLTGTYTISRGWAGGHGFISRHQWMRGGTALHFNVSNKDDVQVWNGDWEGGGIPAFGFWVNEATDSDRRGPFFYHTRFNRTSGNKDASMLITRDYELNSARHTAAWRRYIEGKIYNCRGYFGVDNVTAFSGFELFSSSGIEISYNRMDGGGYIFSIPRLTLYAGHTYTGWSHHNEYDLDVAAWVYETAGAPGRTDTVIPFIQEWDVVRGSRVHATNPTLPAVHNASNNARGIEIRDCDFSEIKNVMVRATSDLDSEGRRVRGGSHNVHDNCVAAGTAVTTSLIDDSTSGASTWTNNGPNGCA